MSVKSIRAIENITKILEEFVPGHYHLEIIDLMKEKHRAIEYQIVALPTLVKIHPAPMRTMLGDLSDRARVLKVLELSKIESE